MLKFYRDDDINVYTSADELKRIHEPFRKKNRVHTVACEMKDLWCNKSLFWFLLNDPFINVELHGWIHEDYTDYKDSGNLYEELFKAKEYWEINATRMLACKLEDLSLLNQITTFFPPWNKVSDTIFKVCRELGLRVSYKQEDCHWMFHYWATTVQEVEQMIQ